MTTQPKFTDAAVDAAIEASIDASVRWAIRPRVDATSGINHYRNRRKAPAFRHGDIRLFFANISTIGYQDTSFRSCCQAKHVI
jgi:hypothetical protein